MNNSYFSFFSFDILQEGVVSLKIFLLEFSRQIVKPRISRYLHKNMSRLMKMECAPSEDSDHPGHLPSLISVFAVRLMGS